MNIDIELLESQVHTLSLQLNKTLTDTEREDIESLLNVLGDITDNLKNNKSCTLFNSDKL